MLILGLFITIHLRSKCKRIEKEKTPMKTFLKLFNFKFHPIKT